MMVEMYFHPYIHKCKRNECKKINGQLWTIRHTKDRQTALIFLILYVSDTTAHVKFHLGILLLFLTNVRKLFSYSSREKWKKISKKVLDKVKFKIITSTCVRQMLVKRNSLS